MPESSRDAATTIGPWSADELRQTAIEESGPGTDYDLDDDVRFKSNVAQLVSRRQARAEAKEDPVRPAVFLLHPRIDDPRCEERFPMLNNGLTPINGRLWFVNAAVVSGRYLDLADRSDDDIFRLVTDDLALGSTPAIVLDPRLGGPEIRYYSEGLALEDRYESLRLDCSTLQLSDVLSAIDRVYAACLITSDIQPKSAKLWAEKDRWVPSSDAEELIQLHLKAGLAGAFPTCTIRDEQPMPVGRLDLIVLERIYSGDGYSTTCHAVLELKVLRSFQGKRASVVSPKVTREWIKSGVKQAFAYGQDQLARSTALCCFDMRQNDASEECFEHVRKLAEKLDVTLRRWFLYSKSEYYRDAIAAQR